MLSKWCLLWEKTLEVHDKNIQTLESHLLSTSLHDTYMTKDIPTQLDNLWTQNGHISQALNHKKDKLGVEACSLLTNVHGNNYLQLCMNAHALKQRIQDCLCQCKFELEWLERAYNITVNGESYSIMQSVLTNQSHKELVNTYRLSSSMLRTRNCQIGS